MNPYTRWWLRTSRFIICHPFLTSGHGQSCMRCSLVGLKHGCTLCAASTLLNNVRVSGHWRSRALCTPPCASINPMQHLSQQLGMMFMPELAFVLACEQDVIALLKHSRQFPSATHVVAQRTVNAPTAREEDTLPCVDDANSCAVLPKCLVVLTQNHLNGHTLVVSVEASACR